MGSSPRDHTQTPLGRAINWARMPSHFHSACQSLSGPRLSGSSFNGDARKKGYGWPSRSSRRSSLSRWVKKLAPGSNSPISRRAINARGSPLRSARARSTSPRETPTRKLPVSSLL